MPVWEFQNPPLGNEICYHSKWDQNTHMQESAGSAVGDISIHQSDQAAIQGGQGKQKFIIYNVFDISTQGCKMTEPGVMNIYWTKIKLRAAVTKQFI